MSDTGDKPAPTTAFELTHTDSADPVGVALKLADLAVISANYAGAVDLPDAPVDVDLGSSYTHLMTSIPYKLQERNYWCGPASTQQVLGYFVTNPASQSTLASELGTTTDGTWFPMVGDVLNDRKPGKNWLLSAVESHSGFISRLDYGYLNGVPGVLHVKLYSQFFPYYAFNHGGHIMTAAGVRKVNDHRYFGGYVDPYNEATYRSGGATTGGFHQNRVHLLFDATQANAGDMIF